MKMDIIGDKFEAVDESSEENGEENVSLVLEESEFIGCDADDEATGEESLHYQYTPRVYTNDKTGETVAYQLLQIDEGDSRGIEVAIPNSVKQPVQLLASPVNGQFYVISNESDTFTAQTIKAYTPHRVSQVQVKSSNSSGESVPKKRDDKRRVTHNEVERRRRDKINTWITVLGKLLPEYKASANEVGDSKHTFESQSKGGILSRACDYILELKETNKTLDRRIVENKQLMQEVKNLRQIVTQLKKQNSLLKCQISGTDDKPDT